MTMLNAIPIEFECLPLRVVSRTDIPVDSSPAYEQFVLRVREAIEKHGRHNTYYLHQGSLSYALTNSSEVGTVHFDFEGTVMTNESDLQTRAADLQIHLRGETCDWLNEQSVAFLTESAKQAIIIEFDRYIAAGDAEKTKERISELEKQAEATEGFIGMFL